MNDAAGAPGRWGGRDVLAWLLLAQLGTGLWFAILGAVWPGGAPADPTMPFLTIGAVVPWVGYGLGPVISTTMNGDGPRTELGAWFRGRDVPIGLIIGALTQFPVVWVLYFPILWFVDGNPSDAARELVDQVNGPLDWALLVLLAGVMAPLVEELFFRGMLLTVLRRHVGAPAAVLVQALIFAAVHFQLLQFPGLLVMGLVTGTLAVRTGRLGPSWAMHAGFNWVTLVTLAVLA